MKLVSTILLLLAATVVAKNIDLSTVPARDSVQLTIYNAEDLTLVRETRRVTFKKGVNPLQFSWANTLIDPTSVQIRFPKAADKLEVLDTTYPHDKPQMLYWNVESSVDGEAAVEITYFTSGLTWSADYTCIANPGETTMDITGFVRVFNQSGEEYENAQVRLVVGTLNLVEKIAELARRRSSIQSKDERDTTITLDVKESAKKQMLAADLYWAYEEMNDAAAGKPKEIVKQSLGEYFLYTVEGTETIPNGWSKRLRSFEGQQVPFKIQYRYRLAEYGNQLVRMFIVKNDTESKLGTTPLPDGTARVYRDNGHDGLAFLASQAIKYVPIGKEIELNLGPDPKIIHELIAITSWRDNLWFKRNGVDVYRNLGGQHEIEVDDRIAGWEDHTRYIERIRNYSGKPIDVEIRREFPGHAFFISKLNPTQHDYRTVQMTAVCPAGAKTELPYHARTLQGYLAKQQNVTLQSGE